MVLIHKNLREYHIFVTIFTVFVVVFDGLTQLPLKIKIGQTGSAWAGGDPCRAFSSKYSLAYGMDEDFLHLEFESV